MKNLKTGEKSKKCGHLTLITRNVTAGWNIAYIYQGDRVALGYGITASKAIADAFASLFADSLKANI